MRCGDVFTPGRASGSTCSTYPKRSDRRRKRWIQTTGRRTPGRSRAPGRPENLLELVGRRDLELIVAAVDGPLVRTPPQENRRVTETITLEMIVLHLTDALDSERLPREVLPRAPAALTSRHAGH